MKNYQRKKGQSMPSDIGMTLLFLIILLVLAMVIIFIQFMILFPTIENGQITTTKLISYSIDFVSIINKPFMVTEVLLHEKFGDRQLLEQSIETMTAGVDGAGTTELPANINSFVKQYEMNSYSISINQGNNQLLNVESTNFRCGENSEGWCVFDKCDTGRVEISNSACPSPWQKCCKEDKEEYARQTNKPVVTCGNARGVCAEGTKPVWAVFSRHTCTQNRIDLGPQPECTGTTTVCCAPKTDENEIAAGLSMKAVVPLLFRESYGTLEVTAK